MSRVYVVGSINVDLVCGAPAIPRPGETLMGGDFAIHPGGKGANQAVAAARLGAATSMVGRVGDDAFGIQQRSFLNGEGIDLTDVRDTPGVSTGVALIVVAQNGQNSIVVVPGANGRLEAGDIAAAFAPGDVVVCQFEIPLGTVEATLSRARAAGATTVLNPAPARAWPEACRALADIMVVNETELAFFAGQHEADPADVETIIRDLRAVRAAPAQTVVATLGASGLIACRADEEIVLRGHRARAVDTTAAGDTFVGALAARLAASDSLRAALAYANRAAAICVERPGAGPSIPRAEEVSARLDDS